MCIYWDGNCTTSIMHVLLYFFFERWDAVGIPYFVFSTSLHTYDRDFGSRKAFQYFTEVGTTIQLKALHWKGQGLENAAKVTLWHAQAPSRVCGGISYGDSIAAADFPVLDFLETARYEGKLFTKQDINFSAWIPWLQLFSQVHVQHCWQPKMYSRTTTLLPSTPGRIRMTIFRPEYNIYPMCLSSSRQESTCLEAEGSPTRNDIIEPSAYSLPCSRFIL